MRNHICLLRLYLQKKIVHFVIIHPSVQSTKAWVFEVITVFICAYFSHRSQPSKQLEATAQPAHRCTIASIYLCRQRTYDCGVFDSTKQQCQRWACSQASRPVRIMLSYQSLCVFSEMPLCVWIAERGLENYCFLCEHVESIVGVSLWSMSCKVKYFFFFTLHFCLCETSNFWILIIFTC